MYLRPRTCTCVHIHVQVLGGEECDLINCAQYLCLQMALCCSSVAFHTLTAHVLVQCTCILLTVQNVGVVVECPLANISEYSVNLENNGTYMYIHVYLHRSLLCNRFV